MDPSGELSLTLGIVVKHGIIAIFGGIAHAINAVRNGESKGLLDFVFLSILSSFFGLLFGFFAIYFFGSNEYLTISIAGTGGFLGVESMKMINPMLRRLLNVK